MPNINDSDNFYDWLVDTKDQNLTRVRNSVDSGTFQTGSIGKPSNPIVANLENNPSLVEDFKERKASQAEARAIKGQNVISEQGWNKWQEKRAMPFIVGGLAYYFFFR